MLSLFLQSVVCVEVADHGRLVRLVNEVHRGRDGIVLRAYVHCAPFPRVQLQCSGAPSCVSTPVGIQYSLWLFTVACSIQS